MTGRRLWLLLVLPGLAALVAFALFMPQVRLLAATGLWLCGLLLAGIVYRPTRWVAAGLTLALAVTVYATLRPVCVMIPDAELAGFDPPIEQRLDVSGIYPLFQRKDDGHWYQCKMAISRWLFF